MKSLNLLNFVNNTEARQTSFWLTLGLALSLAASCTEDPLKSAVDGKSTDPNVAGVVDATRRTNGTIGIGLRGMKGVQQYEVYELETDTKSSADGKETRVLRTVQHSPGILDYQLETFDIPFGKNFCYRARTVGGDGVSKTNLGLKACLQDNNSWSFAGVKQAKADQSGRIALSWNRIPTDGVTYQVFRRFSNTQEEHAKDSTFEVYDKSEYIDEVLENVFPRCYIIRVNHPLFSRVDDNQKEICVTKETYSAQVLSNPDALAPEFAGLEKVSIVESTEKKSVLSAVKQTIGLESKLKVRLNWSKAEDNLTPSHRISYLVYRSENGKFDENAPLATTEPGALSFIDENVPDRTRFQYLVRAVDDHGNFDNNTEWKDIPLDFEAPSFSGIATAKPERKDSNVHLRLTWEKAIDNKTPQSLIRYLVYRAPFGQDLEFETPLASVEGDSQYVDKEVTKGTKYIYAVRAKDETNNTDTNTKTIEALATGSGPSFSGLQTATRDGNKALLTWNQAVPTDGSNATEIAYAVYRSNSQDDFDMNTPILRTAANATLAEDASSSYQSTYFYRVRAVDKNGFEDDNLKTMQLELNKAPKWDLNTKPNEPGPEWVNLTSKKLSWDKTQNGAILTWSPPKDDYTKSKDLVYYIYKSSSKNSFNYNSYLAKVTAVGGTEQLTYVDKEGHQFGQGYFYVVRAEDEFKAVSLSSSIVELAPNGKPTKPVITSAILNRDNNRVTVGWNAGVDDRTATEQLAYDVYRFEKRNDSLYTLVSANKLSRLDGSKSAFEDPTTLDTSKEYVWILQVIDSTSLESDPSDPKAPEDNTPPSAGGVISAIRSTSELVTLAWSPSVDTQQAILSYKIYALEVPDNTPPGLSTDPAAVANLFFTANLKQTITGNTTTLTFGNFNRSKAYLFGVRAFDSMGAFDANTKGAVVSGNPRPTFAGATLAELVLQTGNGRLTWVPGSDDSASSELDYKIYKLENTQTTATAEDVLTQGVFYATAGAGQTVYQDAALKPSVTTHYLVRCVDALGAEDTNTVVKSIAPDTTKPTFLGIKNSSMVGRRITLTWDAASDNRSAPIKMVYKVYESTSSVLADLLATTPIASLTDGVLSYSRTPDTNLTHSYVVRAFDEAGNSDLNEVVKQTVDVIPPVFAGLQNGYAITNKSIQLFWTGIPDEDIYQVKIFRSDDLTTPVAAVNARDTQGVWVNSYLITGLNPAASYSYVARAVDGAGNTETNTATVQVTTLAGEAPLFAGLQSAEPGLGLDGMSKIELKWSAAQGASHYRIFRIVGTSSVGAEFNYNFATCSTQWNSPSQPGCLQIDAENALSYMAFNLNKNTQYSFIVRAVNIANEMVIGEEQNRVIKSPRTLDEVAPSFAGALSAVPAAGDAGLNSIVVKWDPPQRNGVWDGFQVLYKDFLSNTAATNFTVPVNFGSDPAMGVFTVADVSAGQATIGGLQYGRHYCFTIVTRYLAIPALRSVPDSPAGFKCTQPTAQAPEFNGVKAEVEKGTGAQAFTQFKVSWDPAIGSFTRYEISWSKTDDYVSPNNTGSFFTVAPKTAQITTRATGFYTITGLDPNETYYVRVRAVFDRPTDNIFLFSGTGPVTQNITQPKIPNGDGVLSVTQVSDDEVEVKWDPPNNNGFFNTYHIFRALGSGADSDVVAQTAPDLGKTPPYTSAPFASIPSNSGAFTQRLFTNAGVFPDTRYCYLVKAAYMGSEGFVSSPNTKTKCADVVISPPVFNGITALAAPNSASGFTSLVASWEKATGNFSKYQFSVTSGPTDAPVWIDVNGSIDTTSVTIPGLTENTAYYVRVQAVYVKSGSTFAAGESNQLTGTTTPKAPQQAGLEPIEFLGIPGEVKLKWDLPDADPNVGGLYDRFFLWKFQNGSAPLIMDEIDTLMSDDVISYNETTGSYNSSYNVDEILSSSQTTLELKGSSKLTENIQTCFLIRAAYRASNDSKRFVMSSNQVVRCVTPTASAPLFGGLATLENIPLTVNGFSSVKATWVPAQGNFTRYEIVLFSATGGTTWTPRAAATTAINENFRLLYNQNESGDPTTALSTKSHQTLYGRMRAIYVGGDNTVYAAGESTELPVTVRPSKPVGDGILSADATKIPGEPASTALVLKGNASGFWDKYYIWREVHDDQSTAYNAVLNKAKANTAGLAFFAAPQLTVPRTSATSTNNINFLDTTVAVGKYNCYIGRAGYSLSPNFLLSDTPQTPICVRPQYNPISFAGLASSGSEVCDVENPSNPQPCSASTRWPFTGNSKIRLKFASAPAGDIDFFDVYLGSSDNPATLLASTPFQSIAKGDAIHDPDDSDVYLHVGGLPEQNIPGGKLYALVRARCLGCSYSDSNTSVSNPIEALTPYVASSYNMKLQSGSAIWTTNTAGYGVLEDEGGQGAMGSSGFAELTGDVDYLKATNPVDFAPKPGRTIGIKFSLAAKGTTLQNVEGSAVFAAETGNRQPWWRAQGTNYSLVEGSVLGAPGASTVYDKRNKMCLFVGGYAGQGMDIADYPSRDWRYIWNNSNRYYALRFQGWDGQNLGEIRTRGGANDSPLPRSMPVLAHNPISGNVILFGGFNQGSPQRLMADTWEWDGRKWSKLADGPQGNQMVAGEVGRYGHGVMTHDPYRNEMMLVGGRYKVWDNSTQDWNMARTTTTGQGNMGELAILRDVRNDKLWHFRPDSSGNMNWQVTSTLPSNFPAGYPAQLVTVPSGPGAGVYYFSARWDGWENSPASNNVWRYDGQNWTEIPDSGWTGALRPWTNLYGAWDSVKGRIILTFARGNEETGQVVWEFNPDPALVASAAWTTRSLSSSPFTKYGAQPCFHEETRDLVIPGGLPNYWINDQVTKRSQLSQDVHVFNTSTNSWRLEDLKSDPSSWGTMATHEGLKGVYQVGGPEWQTYSGWWEWTSAFANRLFKNGFWNEIAIDPAKKFRWGGQHGVNHWADGKMDSNSTAPGVGEVYVVYKSDQHQIAAATPAQAIVEYGQPKTIKQFDGSGWTDTPVTATNLTLPPRYCTDPNVTSYGAHTYSYPQFRLPWISVQTDRGMFASTYDTEVYWPYQFDPLTTPVCSAGQSWRNGNKPFLLVTKTGNEATVNEIKRYGADGWSPGNPNKFCAPPSEAVADVYLRETPYMQYDPLTKKIWLFGRRTGDWSAYHRNIQAISFSTDSNCYQVENFNAQFETQGWNEIWSYNYQMDYWGFDKDRQVITVLGKHNTSSTVADGATNGVLWELNLITKQWKQRLLPAEFRRWSTLQGNSRVRVSQLPGKTGEYYVTSGIEQTSTGRYLAEGYILKVTATALTLKPILPRFGLTLGSASGSGAGTAGYLSVPGDNGDPDMVYGGEQLYQGRRKISDDLLGENELYIVFGTGTYTVYLNGSAVAAASNIPWDSASGLYMMDFLVGARYGSFYWADDVSQAGFKGIGNSNVSVDWIKTFNKELTPIEMDFWTNREDNGGVAP